MDWDRVPAVAALDPADEQARQAHHQKINFAPEQGQQFYAPLIAIFYLFFIIWRQGEILSVYTVVLFILCCWWTRCLRTLYY